jgi:putative endonuclease
VRALSLPGAAAERRARRHYRLRGYRILGANIRLAGVEVDLLCRRRGTAVFCEVKEKSGDDFGDPLEMVDERKQARLRRAAEAWLAQEPGLDLTVRFDVVAVRGGELERIEDAF